MANRWGNSGNSDRLYFGGAPKSLQMVTAAMKLKRCLFLGRKGMTNLVKWNEVAQLCPTLCNPMDCSLPQSMEFSRQEYRSGLPFNRDITLSTKVHLVKAMVFTVVMYGCESWTLKKAEHQRIDAFELWCWRRLLRATELNWTDAMISWVLHTHNPIYYLVIKMILFTT